MKRIAFLLIPLGIVLVVLMTASTSLATSSESFSEVGGEIFDDWDVCRTRAYGADGFFQIVSEAEFRPVITFESLGDDVDKAYELGQQFKEEYPNRVQRAEMIFYFVRDHVQYTPDIDQFRFEEFAQNADELATTIDQQGFGRGDCEDSAILLAVMYKGAGYRSAIILPSGHAAAAVYLPEYNKANVLEFKGEPGWIWTEATGRNNPFGWIPEQYRGARLAAYEVSDESIAGGGTSTVPGTSVAKTGGNVPLLASPFISVIALMFILSLFRGRRRRRA
jgi:hypothetical protein